ncbi:MAG TPA: hypothetical protein VMU89_09175 [Thermomicrobiaceae bacterium]|nr:hypothetical protein [Thermomicrobiaceae bacterium]
MFHRTQRFGIIVPVALIALLPSGGGAITLLTLATIGFAGGFILRHPWSVAGVPLLVMAGLLGWVASHGQISSLWSGLSFIGVALALMLYLLWFAAPTILGAAAGVALRGLLEEPTTGDLAR